jgi:hypothetical protein
VNPRQDSAPQNLRNWQLTTCNYNYNWQLQLQLQLRLGLAHLMGRAVIVMKNEMIKPFIYMN